MISPNLIILPQTENTHLWRTSTRMLRGPWWMLVQPMERQTWATAARRDCLVRSDSVTVIISTLINHLEIINLFQI